VFAFLRYVSIHLGTFCDSSGISSRGVPIPIRHHKREKIAADQEIVFSSKNLVSPLPNQGRDSYRSLVAASNGKRIDNGYCRIVYFKKERSCETRPSLDRHGTSGYSDVTYS
jgi:hypothetical protein